VTEVARSVVLDYLTTHGWRQKDQGPSGDLWTRGEAITVVPRDLEAGSSPWTRLAVALAQVENAPAEDVLLDWRNRLVHSLEVRSSPGPRTRQGPGRVEFEVHLDGVTIQDHQAGAYDFGRFVMRTADCVKELVKAARGFRHHSRNLLVFGGPSAGSVKVTFREPDWSDSAALLPEAPETAEGQALVFMAGVFSAATEAANEPVADGLRSHLVSIDARSRYSIARVAETLLDPGWALTGTIRRGGEEAPIELGPHAAHVLSTISREGYEEERTEPLSGTLDGWVWSSSEMTLRTDDHRTVRVSVPMDLQSVVGELHAQPQTPVQTRLRVLRRLASGTRDTVTTTYSLAEIGPDTQRTLTIDL
jgi:hypothetical protein